MNADPNGLYPFQLSSANARLYYGNKEDKQYAILHLCTFKTPIIYIFLGSCLFSFYCNNQFSYYKHHLLY